MQTVIEYFHITIGNELQTSLYQGDDWEEDVATLSQACVWAICITSPSNSNLTGPIDFLHGNDFPPERQDQLGLYQETVAQTDSCE